MPKLNQRGVIHLFILLILIAGLIAGLYLIGKTQIFKPKASVSGPTTPQTSFVLIPQTPTASVGDIVAVQLAVRSDISSSNLFNAKINFDNTLLSVDHIDYSGTLVTNWVEQLSDNSTGNISLVGGVPNPGFQTSITNPPAWMATIYFKTLKAGNPTLSFTDSSAIYSNADNTNILTGKDSVSISVSNQATSTPAPSASSTPNPTPVSSSPTIASVSPTSATPGSNVLIQGNNFLTNNVDVASLQIWLVHDDNSVYTLATKLQSDYPPNWEITSISFRVPDSAPAQSGQLKVLVNNRYANAPERFTILAPSPSPTASPTNSPIPSVTPAPGTGDGNHDGKVDFIDLSILLSNINKTSGINTAIDMNGDGVINAADFGLMRNLLIQRGIIRG